MELAKALKIKNHMIKEEADVAKNVDAAIKAWRKKWDGKLHANDAQREAADAAELKKVETEEWNIKQRVVKNAVDAKLGSWAKQLAASVEKARKIRVAADRKDRERATQAAIDIALKKW